VLLSAVQCATTIGRLAGLGGEVCLCTAAQPRSRAWPRLRLFYGLLLRLVDGVGGWKAMQLESMGC